MGKPVYTVTQRVTSKGNDAADNRGDPEYAAELKLKIDAAMSAGADRSESDLVIDDVAAVAPEKKLGKPSAVETMRGLSVTHRLNEMFTIIRNSTFIFPEMLMMGVIAQWYGLPNSGKTLMLIHLLREAIKDDCIEARDVFYINADDNFVGVYDKGRIFENMGANLISPDASGVSPSEIINLILKIAEEGDAEGKLVILDTQKKFTDMMSKTAQSQFFAALRKFTAQSGTVLLLGHANKHPNLEGELVYEGTGDTKADLDTQHSLNIMSNRTDESQEIVFKCEKDRGKVAMRLGFEYTKTKDMTYLDMVDSIRPVDKHSSTRRKAAKEADALRSKYESVIEFVTALLADEGEMNESDINAAHGAKKLETAAEITGSELKKGLDAMIGIEWTMRRDKTRGNAKVYDLIGAEADRYQKGKDGE
jgi:hypothetical protein